MLTIGGCSYDGRGVSAPAASSSPTAEAVTRVELPADYPLAQVPLADGTVFYGFRLARGWDVQVQVADSSAQQAGLQVLLDVGFEIAEQTDPDPYGSRQYQLTDGTYTVALSTDTPEGGPYGYTVTTPSAWSTEAAISPGATGGDPFSSEADPSLQLRPASTVHDGRMSGAAGPRLVWWPRSTVFPCSTAWVTRGMSW